MRIEIFCPECAKKGNRKKLLEIDSQATGIIYPWCKVCHKNIKINLVPKSAVPK